MTPGFHGVGGGAIPRKVEELGRAGPSWEWGDHGVSLGHPSRAITWAFGHTGHRTHLWARNKNMAGACERAVTSRGGDLRSPTRE